VSEWLSVTQCANELSVSKMTIYRLIHARMLPAARVGRNFRIRRTHWEQYLRYAISEAV
jgi:excisionase family DNA binding protein